MAYQRQKFTSSGSFQVPAGVTEIIIRAWGNGGIGGGGGTGGGGGGGAYSAATVAVTPGEYVTINRNYDHWEAQYNFSAVCKAYDGNTSNSATGAGGGSAALGVGDVKYDGKPGGNGDVGGGSSGIGGGGGAANMGDDSSTAGTDGTSGGAGGYNYGWVVNGFTYACYAGGGGNTGDGSAGTDSSSFDDSVGGGGGGGAGGTGSNGGAGGVGSVFIEWVVPPPTAPSNLVATAISDTEIDLTWNDNSLDETKFELERSPDGVGSWVEINEPAANAFSYSDTGLTAETTYYYRIRAVGPGGNSSYSSTADATTEATPSTGGGVVTPGKVFGFRLGPFGL